VRVEFTKMSGAGNDFIFLGPEYSNLLEEAPDIARLLCPRRVSVGADGLIIVDTSGDRIFMHYFNSDGSEASFCGNGARCLVLYCAARGITSGKMEFESRSGPHSGEVTGAGVRVSMTAPRFLRDLSIDVGGKVFEVALIDAGVPHAVILMKDVVETEGVGSVDVDTIGRAIRMDPEFASEGANVNFVEAAGGFFRIRTYERGVERETLACGSGCVAAAHVVRVKEGAGDSVRLRVASGDLLTVELAEAGSKAAHLVGPARVVFEGQIEVKEM
jgi:diaminopimelate epimerase